MAKAIGIDLGTTNSCVAVMEGGQPVIIPTPEGDRTTPSVVAFTADGERLIGSRARRQQAVNPARTIASVKRQIGTGWHTAMDGRDYNAQVISSMILRKLKEDAEKYLSDTVTDAVITVPAYFNDAQRQATRDAGRIAGLNVLRIINEPTAAALAYGLGSGVQQKVLIYDLGGGTFDVSVIDIGDEVIEVLATAGDNHLGGDDFDKCVTDWLAEEILRRYSFDVRRDQTAMQRVREAAEQAKKELSGQENVTVSLPFLGQKGGEPVHAEIQLSRVRFNDLTRHLVDRTAGPVQQALSDAGLAASELDKVLLVGGSTRIPAVQDKVRALTGKIPAKSINPDECVAMGAAAQALNLSGGSLSLTTAGSGVLLLDVTPMSLSIETLGGVATRLIERNASLPARYSQVFTTAAPYQSSVDIKVLQGERPMAADNKLIGRFQLRGIRRAPAGVPQIEVTFSLDANGILTVSAKDLDTNCQQSITITESDRMSDAEVEQARRDAEQYAAEDDVRRQALTVTREAQHQLVTAEQALAVAGKKLNRDEKKQVKQDCDTLRRLVAKAKPEKLTAADLENIRTAAARLEASSANVRSLFADMNARR